VLSGKKQKEKRATSQSLPRRAKRAQWVVAWGVGNDEQMEKKERKRIENKESNNKQAPRG
jgi:predicted amidohydrolase YtcJ